MLEVRSGADANGLLLVYVIDKKRIKKIVKLEGIFFKKMKSPYLVGLALAFPDSPTEIAGKHVSNPE